MSQDARPDLPRTLSAPGLAVAVFNMVVGAGIFVLPATLAREAGSAAPWAFVVCLVAIGAVVICFAGAGSRVAASGGSYAIVAAGLGPVFGFLAGALIWFGTVLAAAGIGAALMDALKPFFPALAQPVVRALGLAALFAFLGLVNIQGARSGTRMAGLLTVAKLLPLALLLIVGGLHAGTRHAGPVLPAHNFGRAVLLGAFAFQGWEGALSVIGEVRRPERSVPLGLMIAMASIGALYLAIQLTVQSLLGPALAGSTAPLVDAMRAAAPGLAVVVAVGATASMLGYLAADTLSAPRTIYAFARDGYLPRALASTTAKAGAPWAAILLHVTVALVLAITGAFVQLAALSTLAIVSVYALGCVAAVRLQRTGVAMAGKPLRLPGLELAALVGLIGMGWIAAHATREEALKMGAALIVSLVWYFAVRRRARPLTLVG